MSEGAGAHILGEEDVVVAVWEGRRGPSLIWLACGQNRYVWCRQIEHDDTDVGVQHTGQEQIPFKGREDSQVELRLHVHRLIMQQAALSHALLCRRYCVHSPRAARRPLRHGSHLCARGGPFDAVGWLRRAARFRGHRCRLLGRRFDGVIARRSDVCRPWTRRPIRHLT
jgi:hypothetical protein